MKFRKKPVVIEAIQYTGSNWPEVVAFLAWTNGMEPAEPVIHTLGGQMRAAPGDWIIRGVAGEFYPCKDPIFRETYEPVLDPPA